MTNSPQRENYYILLDLDPSTLWSQEDFEKKLKAKQGQWAGQLNHPNPQKKMAAKRNIDNIPKIRELMKDEALRKAEAAAAITIRKAGETQKKDKFEEEYNLSIAKGFVKEDELKKWLTDYAGLITDADVRNRLKRAGISIQSETGKPGTQAATVKIDDVILHGIKSNLEIIYGPGADLYTFLTPLNRNARRGDLTTKAQEILTENKKNSVKDDKLTASDVLGGYALQIFRDDDSKLAYDRDLDERIYNELDAKVKGFASTADKTIYAGQFTKLMNDTATQSRGKITSKQAAERIRQRAREFSLAIQMPDMSAVDDSQLCGNCGTINTRDARNCKSCTTPLRIDCPGCHQSVSTSQNCTNCGFPVGNLPAVRFVLSEASELNSQRRHKIALERLNWARLVLWTTPGGNSQSDEFTRQLDNSLVETRRQIDAVDALRRQLTKHLSEKKFLAAQDLLPQLEAVGIEASSLAAERRQIDEAIKRAEQQFKEVREAENRGVDGVERYQAILIDCADFKPAREALSRTPPQPPKALELKAGQSIVSLSWQASPSKGVKYTVVRKISSRPISTNDGNKLATVASTTFDDTAPEIGLPLFYAIYADREGIPSNDAALTEPVLIRGDVEKITTLINDSEVQLRWTPPANAASIRIRRSENGKLASSTDGIAVPMFDLTRAIDRNLTNGKRYHYGIYAVFQNHKGESLLSPGVFLDVVPEPPPEPIEALQIEVRKTSPHRELRLSWTPPKKGDGAVLQTTTPLNEYQAGDVIPQETLSHLGVLLTGTRAEAVVTIKESGIAYFTPVLIYRGSVWLGKNSEYVALDDVSNLKTTRQVNEIQLRWDWPAGSQQVIVAYNYDNYPNHPDDAHSLSEITRSQYDRNGYWSIGAPAQKDHYIVVFAVAANEAKKLVASGLSSGARSRVSLAGQIVLNYEIRRERKGLFGKGGLILSVSGDGRGVYPPMILVRGQGNLPTSRNNGEEVCRIDEAGDITSNQPLDVPLPESAERSQSYGRLFLSDDSLLDTRGGHIRINHPPKEKTKLF